VAAAPAQLHQGGVDHNPSQPGGEAGAPFELSEMLHNLDQPVLQRIFRVLGRAENPKGGTIELRHVGRQQKA